MEERVEGRERFVSNNLTAVASPCYISRDPAADSGIPNDVRINAEALYTFLLPAITDSCTEYR